MLVSDFHYDLPPGSIAQEPLADRAASRMLHLVRVEGGGSTGWQDRRFRDFPDLLRPDDLLVLNNTRVFPARLYGHRSGERAQTVSPHNPAARDFLLGRVEVLLTRQISEDPNEWECLVRPGRKIGVGEKLSFSASCSSDLSAGHFRPDVPLSDAPHDPDELEAEVTARGSFGQRTIRFRPVADFFARVERIGHVPLPPYIDREDRPADRERYQTVYAMTRGSVAAPTAGLHFTTEILNRIRARGIEIAEITLHVGLGTFQPVRVEKVEDHKLHRESFEISAAAANAINAAKAIGRRVVAIGTTTVRTLEFAAGQTSEIESARSRSGRSADGCVTDRDNMRVDLAHVEPGRSEADIFIYPGYRFRIVNALLTNFHLPQSTLLMLVCALAEREAVLRAYRHAVEAGYRFYSYGDCMFIE
ncbi:MAG: tRNA preQ1(34) S-adenosylmethionine ribosyltransferase-isomerase QueA [Terriglobales bacterium]